MSFYTGHKVVPYRLVTPEKVAALGMVRPEHAEPGTELSMDVLGKRHPVTIVEESPYDPDNLRLRSERSWQRSAKLVRE